MPLFARILRARCRRWWYLISGAMWRGHYAVTIYDIEPGRMFARRYVRVIGAGIPTDEPGVFSEFRIFFER
jgi:hypothetical protein